MLSAQTITANTTFDTLSPPGAVQEFTALLEGELFNVTTIVDTHYRCAARRPALCNAPAVPSRKSLGGQYVCV